MTDPDLILRAAFAQHQAGALDRRRRPLPAGAGATSGGPRRTAPAGRGPRRPGRTGGRHRADPAGDRGQSRHAVAAFQPGRPAARPRPDRTGIAQPSSPASPWHRTTPPRWPPPPGRCTRWDGRPRRWITTPAPWHWPPTTPRYGPNWPPRSSPPAGWRRPCNPATRPCACAPTTPRRTTTAAASCCASTRSTAAEAAFKAALAIQPAHRSALLNLGFAQEAQARGPGCAAHLRTTADPGPGATPPPGCSAACCWVP